MEQNEVLRYQTLKKNSYARYRNYQSVEKYIIVKHKGCFTLKHPHKNTHKKILFNLNIFQQSYNSYVNRIFNQSLYQPIFPGRRLIVICFVS
jgi:hypothetical protein